MFIFGAGLGRVLVSASTKGGPYLGCGTKFTLLIFFGNLCKKLAGATCAYFFDPSCYLGATAIRGLYKGYGTMHHNELFGVERVLTIQTGVGVLRRWWSKAGTGKYRRLAKTFRYKMTGWPSRDAHIHIVEESWPMGCGVRTAISKIGEREHPELPPH